MSKTNEQVWSISGMLNLSRDIQDKFREHPNEVGMGYLVHLVHAMFFGIETLLYALMFMFHAVFPFWCITSGNDGIKAMAEEFTDEDYNDALGNKEL